MTPRWRHTFCLDSRNENLPKKRIHRNYAGTPGRETAPGFLLRGRGAAARGVFVPRPIKGKKISPMNSQPIRPKLNPLVKPVRPGSSRLRRANKNPRIVMPFGLPTLAEHNHS